MCSSGPSTKKALARTVRARRGTELEAYVRGSDPRPSPRAVPTAVPFAPLPDVRDRSRTPEPGRAHKRRDTYTLHGQAGAKGTATVHEQERQCRHVPPRDLSAVCKHRPPLHAGSTFVAAAAAATALATHRALTQTTHPQHEHAPRRGVQFHVTSHDSPRSPRSRTLREGSQIDRASHDPHALARTALHKPRPCRGASLGATPLVVTRASARAGRLTG